MRTLTITRQAFDNYENRAWALLWNGMYYQSNGEEWLPFPYTTTTVGNVEPLIGEEV